MLQPGPHTQIADSFGGRLDDIIGKFSIEFNTTEFLILLAKVNEKKSETRQHINCENKHEINEKLEKLKTLDLIGKYEQNQEKDDQQESTINLN